MERRACFQVDAHEPVTITILQKEVVRSGKFVAVSEEDVQIESEEDLEVGSILKLETDATWMLAEVVQSQSNGAGFCAQLTLLNWIDKSELQSIAQAWYIEEPALQPAPQVLAA